MTDRRCLACGLGDLEFWAKARDVEYCTTPEEYSYWHCRGCHALSISPVPDDRLAEIYPANYYSFSGHKASILHRIKTALDRRLFRHLLRPMMQSHLAGLDVGGGAGWLLTQARRVDPRFDYTVVVDIDSAAEEFARAAGHDYFCGRIEDYETDKRFDLILMLNLIEHVRDPVAVLSAVGKLLTPGGRLVVKTPNYDSLDARLFRHRNWGGYHCPRHWVLFTPESLKLAIDKTNLKLQELSLTQGAPFWTWSVLHWLMQRGWARVDKSEPMHRHPLKPYLLASFAALDFARKPFSRTSQMFAILKPCDS